MHVRIYIYYVIKFDKQKNTCNIETGIKYRIWNGILQIDCIKFFIKKDNVANGLTDFVKRHIFNQVKILSTKKPFIS